jgi:hypothetical protein
VRGGGGGRKFGSRRITGADSRDGGNGDGGFDEGGNGDGGVDDGDIDAGGRTRGIRSVGGSASCGRYPVTEANRGGLPAVRTRRMPPNR